MYASWVLALGVGLLCGQQCAVTLTDHKEVVLHVF